MPDRVWPLVIVLLVLTEQVPLVYLEAELYSKIQPVNAKGALPLLCSVIVLLPQY